MEKVIDIAKYIITKHTNFDWNCTSNAKLQLELYLIQKMYLKQYNKKAFDEYFSVWKWDPVLNKVYYKYNSYAAYDIIKV